MRGWATPSIVRISRANALPFFATVRELHISHHISHHVSAIYLADAVPCQTLTRNLISRAREKGSSSYYTYRRRSGLSTDTCGETGLC